MADHSAVGALVTVRKSLRPKSETTPGIAKSFSAHGVPAAASARAKVRGRSPRTGAERAKRTALGLGVGSGRTSRGMGAQLTPSRPQRPLLGPERAFSAPEGTAPVCWESFMPSPTADL